MPTSNLFKMSKFGAFFVAIVSMAFIMWVQLLSRLPLQQQHQQHQQQMFLGVGGPKSATTLCNPDASLSWKNRPFSSQQSLNHFVPSEPKQPAPPRQRRHCQLQEKDLPRVLAIYFPQFHPDPINDRNWGPGFTDWDSLRAAPPKNRQGIPLPHPLANTTQGGGDLGYYDLRELHVRQQQGRWARDYKVDGFVIHHYWFYDPIHPGPNLHAPLERMLTDGHPNVPFLLNWCASSWSSVWTGKAAGQTQAGTLNKPIVLQKQYWNASDDMIADHYVWLSRFFRHDNYIRIEGQPVLMIYQWYPEMVPILQKLRQHAQQKDGFDTLYIWMGRSATHSDLYDISQLPDATKRVWKRNAQQLELIYPQRDTTGPVWNQTVAYPYPHAWLTQPLSTPGWCRRNVDALSKWPAPQQQDPIVISPEVPAILTTFDNTPRREANKAVLINVDSNPEKVVQRFADSLYAAIYYQACCVNLAVNAPPTSRRFVLINAWNEWAEGMVLEPSTSYGMRFLETVRDVKDRILREGCFAELRA